MPTTNSRPIGNTEQSSPTHTCFARQHDHAETHHALALVAFVQGIEIHASTCCAMKRDIRTGLDNTMRLPPTQVPRAHGGTGHGCDEVHIGGAAGCTKPPMVENLHVAGAAEIALPACDLRFRWSSGCETQLTALCSCGALRSIFIFI